MGNTFYFDWEVTFMEWFQTLCPEALTTVMSALTMCGEQLVLIVVMGFLFWSYDKEYGRFVGVNILVAVVLNPMIKNVFNRRRPYFDNPGIKCLKAVEADADIYDIDAQGFSFPSGHSMNAATVYGSLPAYRKNKWLVIVGIVMPLLVAVSRVYLGVHYPTDVMVGLVCGGLVVFLVSFLQRRVKNKGLLYLIFALLGLPGLFYCKSSDYFTCYGLMIGALGGFLFEEKFVKFENTRQPVRMVLRVAGGGLGYLILNVLLKLPFSSEFLANGSTAAHMVRWGRYLIIGFALIALYPMLFKATAKIGSKEK